MIYLTSHKYRLFNFSELIILSLPTLVFDSFEVCKSGRVSVVTFTICPWNCHNHYFKIAQMLRNKSKQALMADQVPLLSPTKNPTTTLISQKLSTGLTDSDTASISPKSILDTKNSSTSVNPFSYDAKPQTINSCNKTEPEAIGLALIDSLNQENTNLNSPKTINRMALFGSNLKVQIPAAAAAAAVEAPKSPADFGIKTRNSHLLGLSPDSPIPATARAFSRQLSLKEMELSEDYTCVITHGPNPKTTHIFEDVVLISDHSESVSVSTSSSDASIMFSLSCKDSGEESFCSHKYQSEERF